MRFPLLFAMYTAASSAMAQTTAPVREREPNDAPGGALLVALGDTLTGAIDPRRDVDYFTFDAPAGTRLRIDRTGSSGSATFTRIEVNLLDVDGQSSLLWLLEDHEYMAVEYPIARAGRYFLMIRVWDHDDPSPMNPPTPQWTYRVTITGASTTWTPGDPAMAELLAGAVLDPAVAASLPTELFARLDANQNGLLDAGDLRAYLRTRSQ